jgi:hypothetical protein
LLFGVRAMKADKYRREAELCERIAAIASRDHVRDEYHGMAEQYRRMAQLAERDEGADSGDPD